MIAKYLTNNNFFKKYIESYALRQAIANMQLENKDDEMITTFEGNLEMMNNIEAFKWIFKEGTDRLSPYDLTEIAYRVNGGEYNKGFRTTQVEVARAKKFRPLYARQIPQAMFSLFDTYRNIWSALPVYEKEARLHIEIVRIQPYQDGNKRSARILTSYNLCNQNKAPVIIPGRDTDEYFGYIDDYNVDGMTKYLEKRSKIELEFLMGYYTKLCGGVFGKSDQEPEKDVKIYKFTRTEKNSGDSND